MILVGHVQKAFPIKRESQSFKVMAFILGLIQASLDRTQNGAQTNKQHRLK